MNWRQLYKRPDFWLVGFVSGWLAWDRLRKYQFVPENWTEEYWPLLFVCAGVYLLISTRYRDATASVILITLGAILFLIQIDILTPEFVESQLPELILRMLRSLFNLTMLIIA